MDAPGIASRFAVWCLMRDQFAHVRPVEEHLGERADFVYDAEWEPAWMLEHHPDVVLCVNDFHAEVARCLDAAHHAHIPSLVLQDGILEWRCQYENPLFGAGGGAPQHQPVLADKIACIGRQSARQIAAWGNAAKVEVTGMPRLDPLLYRTVRPHRCPGRRILVMTAKKAGFTPEQCAITLRSLQDVRAHLATLPDVEVVWRVSDEMANALGVDNRLREFASAELADLIEQVDAVITTPSTALLEAMLLGRPVAALDYHNVPRFVPTAWTISAREHVPSVIAELRAPSARKLAFQWECLRDCLACDTPAAPRVGALIEYMVEAARCVAHTSSWSLPARLLRAGGEISQPAMPHASLAELYPEQPVFAESDVRTLQARLVRVQKDNDRLKRQLRRRSVSYRLYQLGRSLGERMHVGRISHVRG
ncbi:MAG TPA: hypothetical protein VF166_06440 [Gemmatimonadaceae bacterium]